MNRLRLIAVAFLGLFSASSHADLWGHQVQVEYDYLGGPYGYQSYFNGFVVPSLAGNLRGDYLTVTVRPDSIELNWLMGAYIFQGAFGFNGVTVHVLDGSPIFSASLNPASTWTGFPPSHLTWDGSHVWMDFGWLGSAPDQVLKVDLVFSPAVPEPETYALFLSGLGLLGVARRRKAKLNSLPHIRVEVREEPAEVLAGFFFVTWLSTQGWISVKSPDHRLPVPGPIR